MTKARVLITGATGFTGIHACDFYHKTDLEVIPVSRSDGYKCELTNRSNTDRMIKETQPSFILHLAGANDVGQSWEHPAECVETNMLSTLYIMEAVRKYCPDAKVLVVGSMLQYLPFSTPPRHPYSFSKTVQLMCGMAWGHFYDLSIYLVKPANLIGPGPSSGICSIIAEKVSSSLHKKEKSLVIQLDNALAERDFLDVRDAVSAYYTIITKGKPGIIYEAGTGESRTLESVVNNFSSMTDLFLTAEWTRHEKEPPVQLDTSYLKAMHWIPKYSFSSSLKDTLNYYKNRQEEMK